MGSFLRAGSGFGACEVGGGGGHGATWRPGGSLAGSGREARVEKRDTALRDRIAEITTVGSGSESSRGKPSNWNER
jgi:hypothetical protein